MSDVHVGVGSRWDTVAVCLMSVYPGWTSLHSSPVCPRCSVNCSTPRGHSAWLGSRSCLRLISHYQQRASTCNLKWRNKDGGRAAFNLVFWILRMSLAFSMKTAENVSVTRTWCRNQIFLFVSLILRDSKRTFPGQSHDLSWYTSGSQMLMLMLTSPQAQIFIRLCFSGLSEGHAVTTVPLLLLLLGAGSLFPNSLPLSLTHAGLFGACLAGRCAAIHHVALIIILACSYSKLQIA